MGYEPIMLPLHQLAIYFGCGKWIRTTDLKVMSLARYLCSTPLFICSQGQIRTDITPRIGNNFPNWGLEPRVTGLHYLTIYFELPPRVELGTTDYKSVILPAKLQKHLSYIVQAFYFQFRELVSNLTLLTTVRVPEDITFVLGRGVEPLLPG